MRNCSSPTHENLDTDTPLLDYPAYDRCARELRAEFVLGLIPGWMKRSQFSAKCCVGNHDDTHD